jgi:hypothetical protein
MRRYSLKATRSSATSTILHTKLSTTKILQLNTRTSKSIRWARSTTRVFDTSPTTPTRRTSRIRRVVRLSKVGPLQEESRARANRSTVFQYTYKRPGEEKEYVVVWDYNVGLVRMTPFFKSCKYSKVSPSRHGVGPLTDKCRPYQQKL